MSSWLETDKTQFTITCGDGKAYTPNMLKANLSVTYNVSQFNFRRISGTLIERGNPQGSVYNLELYFQGADHLTTSAAFRKSANDRRAWTITHPKYGTLYVQPIGDLYYDNNDALANVTKVSGPVQETFKKAKIKITLSPIDTITAQKAAIDQDTLTTYTLAVPVIKVKDASYLSKTLKNTYAVVSKGIKDAQDAQQYANQYNQAINEIQAQVISDASSLISLTQQLLSAPATFADSVANRISFLANNMALLDAQLQKSISQTGFAYTQALKNLYLLQGATVMSALCLASNFGVLPTDYAYSSAVLAVIASINSSYTTFLTNLDLLQTHDGSHPDEFVPDAQSMLDLNDQVNYTISVLLGIAAAAKQQRSLTLTKDSNWIYIAWQIYGLMPDDSTVDQVMNDNNAGLNEMLQVKKGRQIVYYV